jgi:hypothetical protein
MVRALNLVCVVLMGISILGLYRVSEQTRVARMELAKTHNQITAEQGAIAVLGTEWGRVANSDRVQQLASAHGMNDAASAQLSSVELMPRRVEDAPLNNSPLHDVNAEVASPSQPLAQSGSQE